MSSESPSWAPFSMCMCVFRNKAIHRGMPRDVYLRLLRDCLPLQCVEKVASVGLVLRDSPPVFNVWLPDALLYQTFDECERVVREFLSHCHLQLETRRVHASFARRGICHDTANVCRVGGIVWRCLCLEWLTSPVLCAVRAAQMGLAKIPPYNTLPCEIPRARLNATLLLRGLELWWI